MNKKTAKGKKRAGTGSLKPKALSAKQARNVKGGMGFAKVNLEYKPQKADG
jgi:hypothetical protein